MSKKKIYWIIAAAAAVAGACYLGYGYYKKSSLNDPRFASGNGSLEATEVNIAAKLAGRLEEVYVKEGDYVTKGQKLARMQTNTLEADLAQARARHNQAIANAESAKSMIEVRKSEVEAKKASVLAAESSLDGAKKHYERFSKLVKSDATSQQQFENAETMFASAKASLAEAKAAVRQAESAVNAAIADAAGADTAILAAKADIDRIQADIDDSLLVAPLDGRIQYRIAEPGEVLSPGGRVLNLVDLNDVYMTFFLPEEKAGRVPQGADVLLFLDAIPEVAIPAKVTYVASVAQFTPKTVETKVERQKLMFRVKAHINTALLKKYIKFVKTGIPGVAWVRLESGAEWPAVLQSAKTKKNTRMLKERLQEELVGE